MATGGKYGAGCPLRPSVLDGGRPPIPLSALLPQRFKLRRSSIKRVAFHFLPELSVGSASGASFRRLEFSVPSHSDLAVSKYNIHAIKARAGCHFTGVYLKRRFPRLPKIARGTIILLAGILIAPGEGIRDYEVQGFRVKVVGGGVSLLSHVSSAGRLGGAGWGERDSVQSNNLVKWGQYHIGDVFRAYLRSLWTLFS